MRQISSHQDLQDLYEAAQRVLDGKAPPEVLRVPLQALDAAVDFRDSEEGQEIVKAIIQSRCIREEFGFPDQTGLLSREPYYDEVNLITISGWITLTDLELGLCDEEEDELDES